MSKTKYPWSVSWTHKNLREFAPCGNYKIAKEEAEIMFNFLKNYFPGEKYSVDVIRTSSAIKLKYASTGYLIKKNSLPCHYGCGV